MKHLWVRGAFEDIEPYRAGKRASEVKRELGLTDIAKLSSNESPLPPLKGAVLAMATAVKGVNRYPDGGCGRLKKKLAAGLGVLGEEIAVGNGSNELLRLLAQVLLDPGDEVVFAWPSFIVYPLVTKIMSASAVTVPLRGYAHDLDAMAEAVTDRTKLIFVCNPNNPTGTVVTADAVTSFLAKIPDNVVVCFDEAYHEYVSEPAYATALRFRERRPNLVVLRTFSKIYGLAGCRVGYGIMDPEIVAAIDKVREPFNVNMVGQIGAYYSLDFPEEIRRRRDETAGERNRLEAALTGLGFAHAASQTNFVYFKPHLPAWEVFETLQSRGLIVRAFKADDCIRATIGTAQENTKLINALKALKA